MASTLETLVVRLVADASKLEQELNKQVTVSRTAGQRIGDAFRVAARGVSLIGVAATGATTALTFAANQAANYADQIDKTAIRTRLARDTLQELRFAADQAGVRFESIEGNIRAFTGRLAEAERGSASVAGTFNRLGVALRAQDGTLRDTEALFLDTLTALSGLENETERAALAVQAFGETGSELLPFLTNGADGIDALRQRARDLGLVLDNEGIAALVAYKDQLSAVQQEFGAVTREITTAFLPILTQGVLPALQGSLLPAVRDFAVQLGVLADKTDETGQPLTDFETNIETVAAAVGGFITDLVALGEVSVGLVQVLVAPFAALGNAIGQVSVGFGNFLDVYRRALSGDFSGFRDRPIDVLFPGGFQGLVDAFTGQAEAGAETIRRGAARFGSFVPGAAVAGAFTPGARTSGVGSGVPGFSGGAPAGTDADPVSIRFGPQANFPTGLAADLALRDAPRSVVPGVFDSRRVPIPGVSVGAITQGDVQAARAAENAAARDLALAASSLRVFTQELDGLRQTRTIPLPGVSASVAGAVPIPIPDVTASGQTQSQLQALAAEANAVALGAAKAQAGLRDFTASLESLRTLRPIPLPAVTAGVTGTALPVGIPLPDVGAIEDATNAQIRAIREQERASQQFAQTVIQSGLQFASDLAGAIRSGSPGGIFNAAAGGIGSIISLFNPLAGQLFGLFGGLAAGFIPDGRSESEATRALGASTQGAPAVEFNLTVNQSLNVQSLTGAGRTAVDGLLNETVRRIEDVIVRNLVPRVNVLEAKVT